MRSPRLIPTGALHGGVQRKQVLSDELRRGADSLHEAGREPTLREVASRLTTPGSMRERVAREVWRKSALNWVPFGVSSPAWMVVDRYAENTEAQFGRGVLEG